MSSRTVSRRKRVVRKQEAPEFSFTREDVESISQALGESDALKARRMAALGKFASLPMPSTRDEPWRRTDIRGLDVNQVKTRAGSKTPVASELLQPLVAESHGALLVLRPGHAPELQMEDDLQEQGVVFTDWATAVREHADILDRYMGTVVPARDGKFAALATAMSQEGVLLYVPTGVQLQQPLHSIFWAPGTDAAFFHRVLIVLERGASAMFFHETASPTENEGQTVHAGIVEVFVAEEASLKFVEVQNLGGHVWNFTHERAKVAREGRLDWIFGAVGSQLTKTFSDLDLTGQGAEGRFSGFYFASERQHFDHDTQQNHLAPNTMSDLLYKGALIDQSRSVWQGMIYVAPEAQKTDGFQANRNLILSKKARADSIPGLEILADDVRCTHGATVGQLEDLPIYYLMTRGFPREEAERMMIDGFFAPIMERIPFDGVRERFRGMIEAKLGN
ncbi:MAG: Fe-S cluster assembly protein SufD [Anaerolineales bacterium]|nr:Fe-S cluster assembly protein SufD [Anaerolineales bacterium]